MIIHLLFMKDIVQFILCCTNMLSRDKLFSLSWDLTI
jgi:hypothetical protein